MKKIVLILTAALSTFAAAENNKVTQPTHYVLVLDTSESMVNKVPGKGTTYGKTLWAGANRILGVLKGKDSGLLTVVTFADCQKITASKLRIGQSGMPKSIPATTSGCQVSTGASTDLVGTFDLIGKAFAGKNTVVIFFTDGWHQVPNQPDALSRKQAAKALSTFAPKFKSVHFLGVDSEIQTSFETACPNNCAFKPIETLNDGISQVISDLEAQ